MKRLEIHISYSCKNNCIFCSEKKRLQKFKDYHINFGEIINLLSEKRQLGFNHVNFTGGEPTLYKNFKELLIQTKNLGYRIYIGSNGINWANEDTCQQLLPLIDELSFSLHGPDSKTHNSLTQNPKSFSMLMKACKNINEYIEEHKKPYWFCNVLVTKNNLDKIDEIFSKMKIFNNLKQILVSNLAPEGSAYDNYKKLAVPFTEFRKKIGGWVKLAEKNNLIIRFFGLPICALGKYHVYSNDLNWDARTTFELDIENKKVVLKEKKTVIDRKRQKIKICVNCLYNKICSGIFSHYLKVFGESEMANFQ